MPEPLRLWIGGEEYGGVPTPTRRGDPNPPSWRLEAIAATERPRSISLGRDGRSLAFIEDRDTSDVWLVDLEEGAPRRLTTGRDPMPYWEDTTPAISPDGTTVAFADRGAVWLVATAGGPPRQLVAAGAPVWLDSERLVVGIDRDDCSRLAVVANADPWPQPLGRSSPAGLDLVGDEGSVAVSPDGARVAFSFRPRADLNRTEIRVVDVGTGAVRALTGASGIHDREPAWSPDGRLVAFTAQRDEWYELRTVEVETGDERLLAAADADFSEPSWHPDGTRLVAVRSAGFTADLVVVDAASGAVTVVAAGGLYGAPQWTSSGAIVATYDDHATPPEVRVIHDDGSRRPILAPAPLAVRAAPHVRPQEVSFRSADGLEIEALLFLPTDGPRPAPAVVYPHGGPTSFFGDNWDGHAQYFVDKGYAWLALNFRGSTGRGRTFERANFDDWGGADMRDCVAAADFLRTLDPVDGDRLAIFGASYGSYMSLCAAVEDAGERFRCAVCKYGDCDLLTTWTQGDRDGVLFTGENMLGHPSENRDAWLRGSPVHRLERLAVPLLIAHGELDERVHPKQSEQLVTELRRLGKTFEYVTYPTEAHGFLRVGPQLDFYRRLERFLDWYLL
jgi:dipeptidyl aminopeptidase/acylaminoacyl peptidase